MIHAHQSQHNSSRETHEKYMLASFTLPLQSPFRCSPKYMLQINNTNIIERCEICSKLITEAPKRHSGVFIVNFEHITYLLLVFE